jgi:hypothetical protein
MMPNFKLSVLSVCALLFIALTGVIVWASVESNVMQGIEEMSALRWGIATFTDFYIGATFVGVWIGVMEKSVARGIVWTLAVYILGNLATLIYVGLRARTSEKFTDIFALR